MEPVTRSSLCDARRIILKIGSAVITREDGSGLDQGVLESIAEEVAQLMATGHEVVIVSSGAIALGLQELGQAGPPADMASRQAFAAIGQSHLMRAWREVFQGHDRTVAQVLLTEDDFRNRKRYLNARHAMQAMLSLGAVPVVNENDTVAIEEIKFGDNDRLSGQVAVLLSADVLVMLSVVDGLYDKDPTQDPEAGRIASVERFTPELEALGAHGTSSVGTGGMASKLSAARIAGRSGIPSVVASGRRPGVVQAVLSGADVGTFFGDCADRVTARKHWIAFTLKPGGDIGVDEGAAKALTQRGKSLLPRGIVEVEGVWGVGDAVRIVDPGGVEVARGLSRYSSQDVARIAGKRSDEIVGVIGHWFGDAVIHRDDMVLMGTEGMVDTDQSIPKTS
jgi:glutamate 5-kinase